MILSINKVEFSRFLRASVILFFILVSHQSKAQEFVVDTTSIRHILNEIVLPLNEGKVETVLNHMRFPFDLEVEKLTRAQVKARFNELFSPELRAELLSMNDYEAMNFDNDAYMMVCSSAPEGYEAAVAVFELVNGKWTFTGMDLYAE